MSLRSRTNLSYEMAAAKPVRNLGVTDIVELAWLKDYDLTPVSGKLICIKACSCKISHAGLSVKVSD